MDASAFLRRAPSAPMERPQEGPSGAVAGPSAMAPHATTKSVDSTPEVAATGLSSVGGAEMDVEADAAARDGAEQNGARRTKRQRNRSIETFHPLRLSPQREAAAEQLHQRRQRKKAAAAAVLAVEEASRAKEAKNPEKARVRKEKEEAAAEQPSSSACARRGVPWLSSSVGLRARKVTERKRERRKEE